MFSAHNTFILKNILFKIVLKISETHLIKNTQKKTSDIMVSAYVGNINNVYF